ncbi:lipoyl domain-containing protein [Luteolibacter sp. GHJ8]|uniref:Lipoyl domain-containing protein n=1 Tax=Luteolibacter rhizosphaerae TaxID=2989719 RepID=A0ABT3G9M0_9BACT|nr:lipoyl domain-containing protein [Luteolibacter rhizosphaerae]MCW1916541.1 lipoyl domain-containing protein [Luteolibacter rhizosphaerae]
MIRLKVRAPYSGEKVKDCKLVRWHREDGAAVEVGALIATLETRKAVNEIEAADAGVLRHLVKEGDTVAIGACFAMIENDGLREEGDALHLTMEISRDDLAAIDARRGELSRDEYALRCVRERLEQDASASSSHSDEA